MSIAGIVLAGGKSSRYGQPKMFETYNKKSFYEYSIDALKENHVTPILVSTNQDLLPYFQRKDGRSDGPNTAQEDQVTTLLL